MIAIRERGGRTLPFVAITEDQAVPFVRQSIQLRSTVYADEASSWDALHAHYDARRINNSIAFGWGSAMASYIARMAEFVASDARGKLAVARYIR